MLLHIVVHTKMCYSATALVYLIIKNLLHSNGRYSIVRFTAVAQKRILFRSHSLAAAASLVTQFLLLANMPQSVRMEWRIKSICN
jgi:hypothetical protein